MATQSEYAAVTAALVKLAQAIVAEKDIPEIFVPASAIQDYAARAAKTSVDTLDAFRMSEKGN